jgi:uncharacterized protein YutE (UPF0331/DUF86 family)
MAPEVVSRKLSQLATYLAELRRHLGRPLPETGDARYAVERLVQLVVEVLADLVSHLLAEAGAPPAATFRDLFTAAGAAGLLPPDLARRLAVAAALRDLIVYVYGRVDPAQLAAALPDLVADAEAAARAFVHPGAPPDAA